jgi:hypothetical protein
MELAGEGFIKVATSKRWRTRVRWPFAGRVCLAAGWASPEPRFDFFSLKMTAMVHLSVDAGGV